MIRVYQNTESPDDYYTLKNTSIEGNWSVEVRKNIAGSITRIESTDKDIFYKILNRYLKDNNLIFKTEISIIPLELSKIS